MAIGVVAIKAATSQWLIAMMANNLMQIVQEYYCYYLRLL